MRRSVAAAVAITTVGTLPVFLLSAQAVLISDDLGLSEAQLGVAVTVFFASAAVSSVPVGRLAQRTGARRSVMMAGLLATVSLLGLAVMPPRLIVMMVLLAIAGVSNALAQVAANLILAQAVPTHRQGLAFGIKQSAVPLATFIGGLTVPVVGLTVGWRWGFAAATALCLAISFAAPWASTRTTSGRRGEKQPATPKATRPLILVAVATAFASGAMNATAVFLVIWATRQGMAVSAAGLLLAAASLVSIAARIVAGLAADRRGGRNLHVAAVQIALGAAGLVLIATGSGPMLVAGALLAFGIGWSWPGLLIFGIVRLAPSATAASTSIVQIGAFAGGAGGPALFGLIVQASSFRTAWLVGAGSLLLSSALLIVGRHQLRARPGFDPD